MAQVRGRYTAAIAGNVATLTPKAGAEDEDRSGAPGLLGGGTLVLTTTPATIDPTFWKVGGEYLIEISRVN